MLTAGSSTIQQLVALKLKQNLRRPQLESQLTFAVIAGVAENAPAFIVVPVAILTGILIGIPAGAYVGSVLTIFSNTCDDSKRSCFRNNINKG
jgi:hypothetical protein